MRVWISRNPFCYPSSNCSDLNPPLPAVFESLVRGRGAPERPRKLLVADIDPVYDSAAILDEKFKLIVGKPAALSFDQVYPLITVSTGYQLLLHSSFVKSILVGEDFTESRLLPNDSK